MYFAMITLALSQLVYFIYVRSPFTGGENGIQQVPRGYLFGFIDLGNDLTLYYVIAVIFMACFLLVFRIIHSPFGQVVKAIRENETRVVSLGYKPAHYKLILFVIAAAMSGLAGSLKAIVFQLAHCVDVTAMPDETAPRRGDDFAVHQLRTTADIASPIPGLGHAFRWLDAPEGVLAFARGEVGDPDGLIHLTNLSPRPVALPPHAGLLVASADVSEGHLPVDASVWLRPLADEAETSTEVTA